MTPGHGKLSTALMKTLPFRFMRWRLSMIGEGEPLERQVEAKLVDALTGTPELDAAAILAFDAVYTPDGILDDARTHFYVTNDYAIELCRKHPMMLFGASVHPFRKDAVAELQRCIDAGAVLLKWLPIVQGFSPADSQCIPLFEMLAHYKVPLLSHTGGERTLIRLNEEYAPPRLLEEALQRGVTVIAAHCGTRSAAGEADYVDEFVSMVRRHENLYGDTAALNLPARTHAYDVILTDPLVRNRIVHGRDWPVIALPPPMRVGPLASIELMREKNWLRRDVMIKQRLGFDDAYWRRAASVLRLPAKVDLRPPIVSAG